jgi:Ca-activated chloride channel family protein
VRFFAALATAFVLAWAGAGAQAIDRPAAVPQLPTFHSAASLVSLNVTVTDGGKFVSGLQLSDFVIYEDGVKQDVQFFESSAVPVDLIVLIDTSSSMSDRMDVVHEAATGFLNTLRPVDRGAVVTFADAVDVRQPLTSDRAQLAAAIRGTRAHGSTALYNAVYIALKQFGQTASGSAQVRRQAIVVLSDGEDTSSLIGLQDVMAVARRTGVNIYTVSLQSKQPSVHLAGPAGRRFDSAEDAMKTMARETGALAFFPDAAQLNRVYTTIAAEVANQYSIGYVPANVHTDGGFRHVIVQIITRPGLYPRTRTGYTADGLSAAATRQ